MCEKYDDIINLPHHQSAKRPHMSMIDRAAQFSPFAALTGYEDAVDETARLTVQRKELSEDEKALLDLQMNRLLAVLPKKPYVQITYFVPDEKKTGGAYRDICGTVIKIDIYENLLMLEDGGKIFLSDIIKLEFLTDVKHASF